MKRLTDVLFGSLAGFGVIAAAVFFVGLVALAQTISVQPPVPVPVPQSMMQNPSSSVSSGKPACSGANEGQFWVVTDALTPVSLAAVVGGGAVHVLVVCLNGSWIVQ